MERRIAESVSVKCAGHRKRELICARVRVQLHLAVDEERGFVVRYLRVDVLPSARRHGIDDADIDHAVSHATVVEEVADDPIRYLVIGPDRSGNLLELIVMDRPQGPAVIHAMAMRAKYRRLLPPGES